jgi:hypothetical protein
VFPGSLECRTAVERVRRQAGDLVPVVVADAGTGRWSWRLELDGVAVAVAARPYQRQREGKYNLTRFLSALQDAALSDLGPTTRRVERAALTRSGRIRSGRMRDRLT